MMDKKQEEAARQKQSAETIIARMKEESSQGVSEAIAGARKESERIMQEAYDEADRTRVRLLDGLRTDLEKMRERIFSGLSLEKKRLMLEEKDRFINQVLETVRQRSVEFRANAGYADFLTRAVAEGARVIGARDLVVTYATLDERIFASPGFAAGIESFCRKAVNHDCSLSFEKGDFEEIGVIVSSRDKAIRFDNRFSRRLARMQADIYDTLLKESF